MWLLGWLPLDWGWVSYLFLVSGSGRQEKHVTRIGSYRFISIRFLFCRTLWPSGNCCLILYELLNDISNCIYGKNQWRVIPVILKSSLNNVLAIIVNEFIIMFSPT